MTESLRIDTGVKRILINDGPDYIEFNPTDVVFAEKFYNMVGEFKAKQKEIEERATEIDSLIDVDEYGLPINMLERIKFIEELCDFSYDKIDFLFGKGTSHKLFGGIKSLELIEQFFSGLMPFVQTERAKIIKKYTNTKRKTILK